MRAWVLISIVSLVLATIGGCLPFPVVESVYLTATDDGKTVILQVGQKAIVTVDSNSSTGFSWRLEELDQAIVENNAQAYIGPFVPLAGAAGTERWEFTARSVGVTKLRLDYIRAVVGEADSPADTFEVVFVVREAGDEEIPVADLQLDQQSDGGVVLLPVGGRAVVTLESNSTTGYQWQIVELDQAVLENTGHTYIPPAEDTIGAAGSEQWEFTAREVGQTTLRMEYSRTWDPSDVVSAATFTVAVTVYITD